MKSLVSALVAAACLSSVVAPASADVATADISASVDALFAPWNRADGPGCAVAVVNDGKVVHERGYGMANLDYGIAITPDTVFYIASVSKQFTAAAIALLAEEKKISLDDDLRKYVPEIPAYQKPILVRHLVHHTSGLRDYLELWTKSGRSYADSIPEAEAIASIARQDALDFTPGSAYYYSNSGYFLLSVIVKRASGKPLSQYAQEKIFGPLGMKNTHFHDDRSRVVPNRATAYFKNKADETAFSEFRTSYDLVGDGGVLTTVRDLVRWDQNFYQNKLGTRGAALISQLESTEPLTNGNPGEYAFGLLRREIGGMKAIGHPGTFIGFKADYVRIPAQRTSMITLCNGDVEVTKLSSSVLSAYRPTPRS
ncbi:serine hydrolase domain-containing protein [Steroidobacter sp.]|uniref:serine hydrolase domain-containing protein n=1 Tax=Steroidobacter sp. TaxID=1978227 RepID=UPI001A442A4C|nr:serine hydrolase domain-containing protein [Steroidobacter sp.]MBL8266069.1 beta-lactamase family protein [Steroidobacter sp.]